MEQMQWEKTFEMTWNNNAEILFYKYCRRINEVAPGIFKLISC